MWFRLTYLIVLCVIACYGNEKVEFEETIEAPNFLRLEHPSNSELFSTLKKCGTEVGFCDANFKIIAALCTKVANEHTALLLVDRAKRIFEDILYYTQSNTKIGQKAVQILAVLAFGQGNIKEAEQYWKLLNNTDLLSHRTYAAQIVISGGEADGISAMMNYTTLLGERFYNLSNMKNMKIRPKKQQKKLFDISNILLPSNSSKARDTNTINNGYTVNDSNNVNITVANENSDLNNSTDSITTTEVVESTVSSTSHFTRLPSTSEIEEYMLALVLGEAQGGVRTNIKLNDLTLTTTQIRPLDAKQRFQLGVGLAKLGLFDLSLKHVWLAATPWEAPLYRLRAQLTFASVHTSVRELASTIDNFERHGEAILSNKALHNSPVMVPICNSLNEAALALQALPLLHLAGFASPRYHTSFGHSPVALPVLMSELYSYICPPLSIEERLTVLIRGNSSNSDSATSDKTLLSTASTASSKKKEVRTFESLNEVEAVEKYRVGVVSGSFDGDIGRIMIGLLDGIPKEERKSFEFIAMCFPTPRDVTTNRLNLLFDSHINLSAENKTQAIERIKESKVDFLLFTDIALDARVFAIAHERLALHQGIFWGYGGTLGIPTIDYYFVPEILWKDSKCSVVPKKQKHAMQSISNTQKTGGSFVKKLSLGPGFTVSPTGNIIKNERKSLSQTNKEKAPINNIKVPPQDLYHEQIILLEGLPNLPRPKDIPLNDVYSLMQNRYLLLLGNRTHIYIIPCSIKNIHPEFDVVIHTILKTDPHAVVVIAVARTGRDKLPITHVAIRYDLMHPSMNIAINHRFMQRLKMLVGTDESIYDRVRILPPLDESIHRALVKTATAVLDPFPVGLHVPIIEAISDRIPVISSYTLQECTNSHTHNILSYLTKQVDQNITNSGGGISKRADEFSPNTAEEYGVLAIRINREEKLRNNLIIQHSAELNRFITRSQISAYSHGMQFLKFLNNLRNS